MEQIKNEKLLSAVKLVLKELRAKTGLTQEQVANNIKANKDLSIHIGRNETGNQNMTVSTLYELCEYYKVPISEFFKQVEEVDKGLKIKDINK
ncbi:transcriptional regulator with XRE-family HTH domain [Flavobacterium sp. CG_9.10]|uniref:helix-turn-helix domain-containing protein n=1 Tax=Flavobacterium sp. CG_9.10 TaxID=2787729 RepID=UPI0018CA14E5|nr:helix-turn-helix transcriptional regulator [Flavobacterium sp. CG_9.10]MBG6109816.1 transcriptional regulator with XRE-family HTH domain [Flavobacterium sp. CG_9.10]